MRHGAQALKQLIEPPAENPLAGFSLQEFPYRDNYPCESVPVSLYL
jgi:hypothetical protein